MSMVGLANINVREEHVRVREEEEGQGRYCAFLTTSVMGGFANPIINHQMSFQMDSGLKTMHFLLGKM